MLRIFFWFCLVLINTTFAYKPTKNWGNDPDCIGDEYFGTCVQPRRCFSTNPYIPGLVYPQPCTLADGRPGVCCTDCELVDNANDALLDKVNNFLWKTGEKAWDKCVEYTQKYSYLGCHFTTKATRQKTNSGCHLYGVSGMSPVGGQDVFRGEFPHMALLGYNGTKDPSQWYCSGSLISERFILTAGHCIDSRYLGPVTEVALGLFKRSDPPEHWHKYKIKRVIPHPEYSPPSKYHDIALLETEVPVVFVNGSILPACLPAHEHKIDYSEKATATGWGDLGYLREAADAMQKVSLSKFSDEECSELYPVHRLQNRGINASTQMCYGDKIVIRDTCKGDSGGPLQMDTGYPTCMHTIVGVTSYGQECGFLGSAGVYTKVAPYLLWIESVVWP